MAHQYTCGSCAFQVRSEDQDEVVKLVRTHADEKHDTKMSRQDVQGGLETV